MKTMNIIAMAAALIACGATTAHKDGHTDPASDPSTPGAIRTLDEKGILPVLFPEGRFEGRAYAWVGSEYGGHVAIDTIIRFRQEGREKAAVVMSHYTLEDGERQFARIYINGLSCAILGTREDADWESLAFKKDIMGINSDPSMMRPKVQQAGRSEYILRVASYLDYGMDEQEHVDVAYMNVMDLERVLSTTMGESADFEPSDKVWYDVVVDRYRKGKTRMVWSEAERKYGIPAKAPVKK